MNSVALYCNFSGINHLEFGRVKEENPGIGGTQYLFMLLYQELKKKYNNVILISDSYLSFKDKDFVVSFVTSNINTVLQFCEDNNIEKVIIREQELKKLKKKDYKCKIILWAHNTIDLQTDLKASRIDSVERIVCVSEQQKINMNHYYSYSKVEYINNCVSENYKCLVNFDSLDAVYCGAIVPQKGCYEALKIWKRVVKKMPNSILYIIGGAKLRNHNSSVGSLGICDSKYEKKLLRIYNSLKNNVVFLGVLDHKSIKSVYGKVRLGIVNPSHYNRDETFCLSAVEMEKCGLPVFSRKRNDGLETTVKNNITGYLGKNENDISEKICKLLSKTIEYDTMKILSFGNSFSFDEWFAKWEYILNGDIKTSAHKKKFFGAIKEYFKIFKDRIRLLIYKLF